jgi:CHAT domain-containing protein
MSRLLLLITALAPLATISPFALAIDTTNTPQTLTLASSKQTLSNQVVQSGDAAQLLQQGLRLYKIEQYSQSVQILQQAAEKFQTQGDVLNQALALNYLALAYHQLGELAPANKAIANSLELLEKNPIQSKDYKSVRAQTLNNQGQIQLAQGQSQEALSSWEAANALYSQIGDEQGKIGSQINQAQALQALGLYRRARITLRQLNQQLQQQPDSVLKAQGLMSLGNALRVEGILDRKDTQGKGTESLGSLQVLEQSLAIAKKQNAPKLVAEINLSLGNTYKTLAETNLNSEITSNRRKALEDVTAAIQYYREATTPSASPMTKLVAQMNLLRLSVQAAKQPTKELEKNASYQTMWQNLLPEIQSQLDTLAPSRKTIYARINLAQSLACLKQTTPKKGTTTSLICPISKEEAQNTTITETPEWSAIAQILAKAIEQAKSLEDKRAEAYALGTLGGLYKETRQLEVAQKVTQQASALAESIQAPDVGYRWQWQLGRILKTKGNQKAAIAAYTKAVDNLRTLRRDLVAINPEVQFSFREGVEPVYRELVSLLLQSGNQPSSENLATARDVLESLQLAELDNFFRRACIDAQPVSIDQVDQTAAVIYPVILPDRLEIIVSLPSSSPNQKQGILQRYTVNQSQEVVESAVEQLRLKLETRSTPEFLPLSQEMYNWLIQPIEPKLAANKVKNLVFVLDGVLRNIPMAALYDGKQYLVEKYNVALTPGLQLLNPQPFRLGELQTIAGGLTQSPDPNFPSLPNVENELNAIKSTVPNSRLLVNEQFTTQAIENAVKSLNAPIVHLATHGQFGSTAEDTFILTFDDRVDIEELNELLRSRETIQRNAIELLVLSACSTATGDERAALGIAGVAVRSGARSTLASLWVVDDEATSLIMSDFYKQLRQPNITKAEAFKRAQLGLLKNHQGQYNHPYYWAPYVLVGNWL